LGLQVVGQGHLGAGLVGIGEVGLDLVVLEGAEGG